MNAESLKSIVKTEGKILGAALLLSTSSCTTFSPAEDARIEVYEPPKDRNEGIYYGDINWKQLMHLQQASFPQLTKQERDLIVSVNRKVNKEITYLSDREHYGLADLPVTEPKLSKPRAKGFPIGRYGDCEDYALTKKKRLASAGICPSRLFIALALIPTTDINKRHSVLIIPEGSQWRVLDNIDNRIEPASFLEKWWGWKFINPNYKYYKLSSKAREDNSKKSTLLTNSPKVQQKSHRKTRPSGIVNR